MEIKDKKILISIIEEYIRSASPVGSSSLVLKKKMDCCPATVRNTMMELERQGYLFQPHTSAGRIPTEEAYKFYVETIDRDQELSNIISKKLDSAIIESDIIDLDQRAKFLSRIMADITNNAVLLAFSKDNYYITGFSNILSQPEFSDVEKLQNLSLVLDNLEFIVEDIFEKVNQTGVFVGSQSKFNKHLSAITGRFKNGVVSIIGPTRMDYKKNLGLVNYFKTAI